MNDPCGVPGPPRCPECGTALSISRLEGLCPVCLLEEPTPPDSAAGEEPRLSGPGLMFLPGYRLTREIARGGMGIIYEAVQQNPSRTVAIKMLLPHLMEGPAMRERFRREAQSMAGLDHPGILPIYEVGDHGGLPFFSMKLAPGGTLSSQAWRYRKNWRQIAGLMAHLANAIQTAHHHGVLHRDLKPANILFDEQNRAYLSDFGIAKQLNADPADLNLTKSSTLLGTPNYLPPEWAGGTARSATTAGDLYGLGAIFYQLLTGDPPHRAPQLTTLLRQIADDPVMPPSNRPGDSPRFGGHLPQSHCQGSGPPLLHGGGPRGGSAVMVGWPADQSPACVPDGKTLAVGPPESPARLPCGRVGRRSHFGWQCPVAVVAGFPHESS